MMSLPLITHLIMVAHEVLPIKNNGLPKKNLIFILGHFEWPRKIKNFIHQNAIFIFPQCFFFIFSAFETFTKQYSFSCQCFHDNHTKISNSHWSFQETLGRGVQTKKPFVGVEGSVNCLYFSGTTQYIEEHLHVISGPHTIRDLMIWEWRCLRKGHFKRDFASFQTFSQLGQVA